MGMLFHHQFLLNFNVVVRTMTIWGVIIAFYCILLLDEIVDCKKSKKRTKPLDLASISSKARANDRTTPYNYTSCIMTRVRNVDYLLEEWFQYHIAIGVDRFIVADDCSSDDGKTMSNLEKYERLGVLTLYRKNPHLDCDNFRPNSSLHMSYMFNREKDNCHWIASIDPDEYLFPSKETSTVKFLNDALWKVEFPHIRMLGFIMSNRGDVNRTTEPLIHRYRQGHPELFIKSIAATRVADDWQSSHIPDIEMIWNGVYYKCNVSSAMHKGRDHWSAPMSRCTMPSAPVYVRHFRSMSWEDHLIRKNRTYEATGIKNRYRFDGMDTFLTENISTKCVLPGNVKFLPAVLRQLYPNKKYGVVVDPNSPFRVRRNKTAMIA